MSSPIPSWLALLIASAVFLTMLSLGLLLGREQIEAALRRRVLLAALLFGTLIPVPLIAVLAVKLLGITGVAAAGIVLMAVSPGAPVAMRRALEAGGHSAFAPALHLAIVLCAVVTVPATVAILAHRLRQGFQRLAARHRASGVLRPAAARQPRHRPARLGGPPSLRASRSAWHGSPTCFSSARCVLLVVLWRLLEETGWVPIVAGALLTVCALLVGAAFAWRDAAVRPAAAVAAAMRNPGLALLIAALNKMPTGVVAAVCGYTLGAAVVITSFVAWQGRLKSSAPSLSRSVT